MSTLTKKAPSESAASTLTRLMTEARLLPAAQQALRHKFQSATNTDDMKEAVQMERLRMESVRHRFRPNMSLWGVT